MTVRPSICIDWENVEATFEPGERLRDEDPLVQTDVLQDIANDVGFYREQAFELNYPGLLDRWRRIKNGKRRKVAEALIGQRVTYARALMDGTLGIELSDGRVITIGTVDGELCVGITATPLAKLIEHAEKYSPSDELVEELLPNEPPLGNSDMMLSQMHGKHCGFSMLDDEDLAACLADNPMEDFISEIFKPDES